MVVNFRCSAETKELLDRVVASGRYGDQNAVSEVAVADFARARVELLVKMRSYTETPARSDESGREMNWEGIC
jgi:hypothetical protein